jgi:hypothetical protein
MGRSKRTKKGRVWGPFFFCVVFSIRGRGEAGRAAPIVAGRERKKRVVVVVVVIVVKAKKR